MNALNPCWVLVIDYSFSRVQDSAGLAYGEDVSLLGVAGSGGDDAVRLAGCEGSVSLAWRTGEG